MTRFILPVLFFILIDLYFYQAIKQLTSSSLPSTRTVIRVAYWAVSAGALAVLAWSAVAPRLPHYARYYIFSFMMVLFLPKVIGALPLLVEDVFRFISSILRLFSSAQDSGSGEIGFLPERRTFISKAGIVAAGIPFATMLYGMARTAFNFSVRKRTLSFVDLPSAFDGLKVVQISDLHSGSFPTSTSVREAIDKIMALDADMIFFTGDLVNNEAAEAEAFVPELSRLSAPLGVFSVLGNHDYGDYGPWPSDAAKQENLTRLKAIHAECGWQLLLNAHERISREDEEIAVVGVENWGASRHFPKLGDLDKATDGCADVPFKILLSHDPSHWDAKVKPHDQTFHLTLSGHTHGFQFGIDIPGFKWSPVQYAYKQWAGLYKQGKEHLYVNRGLGFIGFTGRIGIAPEITLLELKRENNA